MELVIEELDVWLTKIEGLHRPTSGILRVAAWHAVLFCLEHEPD